MAEEKRAFEIRLQDPLSEVTRAERKTLLGVSAVGLVIARSGLVPSRISALGIEFDRADQGALLTMLAFVVAYFLAAFVAYAVSDFVAWRIAIREAMVTLLRERKAEELKTAFGRRVQLDAEVLKAEELKQEAEMALRHSGWDSGLRKGLPGRWSSAASRPVSVIRALFEFGVPIVVGVLAIYMLATTPPPRASESAAPKSGAQGAAVQAPVARSAPNQQP